MTGVLQADTIVNNAGSGAPTFTYGLVSSTLVETATLQVTTSATTGYVLTSDGSGNATWQQSSSLGNVAANDSNVIFTNSSLRTQICTPTAARTYTLPTTSIVAGDRWTFYNQATSAANYITIQSSGSNTVAILPPLGLVTLITAVATPTTAANWIVVDKQSQWVTYTPTLGTGYGTATNNTAFFKVVLDNLLVSGSLSLGTAAGSSGSISIPSAFTISSAKISIGNTSSNPGTILGYFGANSTSANGWIVAATSTSTSVVYAAGPTANSAQITPGNVTSYAATGDVFTYNFSVPIVY